ncbi:MAG: phospholipid/cholesterol/gamma-HCH transport system substrate-binding protein [Solirubrobacterales bacterium]|jgi:ABC-type transporter Mla subunit MlaD|nr:phospholipid/cholesterol/gamma-HCH transport system substrate-binding protein [Solirubrobacterales bacterium]
MQKQAPSVGRILIAAGFAISCFLLIMFLWIAFGGPIPLKAKSYRITAYFPEATQLAAESDVRIGGVSVGKVKEVGLAPPDKRIEGYDTTEALLEIRPEFAPISEDAQAILRQKTLLGETYVELTSGTEPGTTDNVSLGAAAGVSDAEAQDIESIEEDGVLDVTATRNATQIDEIFNALDPETRTAFQQWQQSAAVAVKGRSLDLNDAFGNIGPFIGDASATLEVLKGQKESVKGLVRDTGEVFDAVSERDQELAGAITGSEATFGALADADDALAESFTILPTFQRESRATLLRLDEFQRDTRPLVQKLLPVANDISPTLDSVRKLSPNLESLFRNLDPLIDASEDGLPALESFLGPEGLRPVLDTLDPFLANLNPILRYLAAYRKTAADFLVGPGAALAGVLEPQPGQPAARHYLKQLAYTSAEVLSVYPERIAQNRGNAYPPPQYLVLPDNGPRGIFPNFDCKNLDYTPISQDPDEDVHYHVTNEDGSAGPIVGHTGNEGTEVSETFAPCFFGPDQPAIFGGERSPQLYSDP